MSTAIENKFVLPTKKTEVDKRWISQRLLMIGPPKVGKSKFFSFGDKTLYIQCEPGLKHLEVMKVVCNSWDQELTTDDDGIISGGFRQIVSMLISANNTGEFPYDTIVIDTVDRWVDYINDEVVERGKEKFKAASIYGIGDIPNGQGYSGAKDTANIALSKLSELPACIALIGHLASKEISLENNVKMTIQTIALSPSIGMSICSWADQILNIEGGNKTGGRKVRSRPTGSIMAGSRGDLVPENMVWTEDGQSNYSKFRSLFS